jgi:phage-related protein
MADPKVAVTITAKDDASATFKQVGEAGGQAAQFIKDNWKELAVGIGAAGVALEAIARQARDVNVSLDQLAIAVDMDAEVLRNLATETSNATFPLKEVTELFAIAGKQGIKTAEDMQAFATFWDTVGDAIGASSVAMAEGAVGLKAFGVAAGEEQQAMAALGFVHTQTTAGVEEFLRTLTRLAPEAKKVGTDVNEMAAILKVLEERGISGRAALTELNQIMTTAEGREQFLEGLGLTNEQLQAMTQNVEAADGKLQDMANVVLENMTTTEKAAHWMKEFAFEHAELLQAAGMLSAPLMGIGMAIGGIGTIATTAVPALAAIGTTIMSTVIPALTSAAASFIALQVAGGPILWIIEGIALAVVALALAWSRNWGGIQEKTQMVIEYIKYIIGGAWDFVKNIVTTAWGWIQGYYTMIFDTIKSVFEAWWDFVKSFYGGIWDAIKSAFEAAWEFIKGIFDPILDWLTDIFNQWWDFVKDFYGGIWDTIKGVFSAAWDWIKDIFNKGWEFIKGIWTKAIDWIKGLGSAFWDAGVNIIKQLWEGIKSMAHKPIDALKGILQSLRDMLPFSPAKIGPLVGLQESGKNIINEVASGVTENAPSLASAMAQAADSALQAIQAATGGTVSGGQAWAMGLTGGVSLADITRAQIKQSFPRFQAGGIVKKPTIGLFGEDGPEAVIPLSKMGGMGTKNYNVTFTGPMMGNPSEARLFAREIITYIDEENGRDLT